jgi:hypothetical protein
MHCQCCPELRGPKVNRSPKGQLVECMCTEHQQAAWRLLVSAAAKQVVPIGEEEAVVLPARGMVTTRGFKRGHRASPDLQKTANIQEKAACCCQLECQDAPVILPLLVNYSVIIYISR